MSTTHLVNLELIDIPAKGYIPPEVMATSLSALTRLNLLHLHFRPVNHHPTLEGQSPPPLTHTILPNLTTIRFQGNSEYLEGILARIDAPRINEVYITFFDHFMFDTLHLFELISQSPTLSTPERGHIIISDNYIMVKFLSQISHGGTLVVEIPCSEAELRWLAFFHRCCNDFFPSLSTLENLYIQEDPFWKPFWESDVENTLWLQLSRPFAAVKNLYLDKKFVPRFAPALQELVGRRSTEVLPTLENIFLEGFQPSGPLHEGIEKFVAARRLTSHSVAISCWDRDQ